MLGSNKDHHISIDLGFLLIGIIVSASVENSLCITAYSERQQDNAQDMERN